MEPTYMPIDDSHVAAEIDAQRTVFGFKESLAAIRLKLNAAIERKKALADSIRTLLESRATLINMFLDEAYKMEPDLAGRTVREVLSSITVHHPLHAVWLDFRREIWQTQGKLQSSLSQYKSLANQVADFEAEQFKIIDIYAQFIEQSPVEVPSVQAIEADVVAPLPSSVEEDAEIIEEVSALDLLDSETQVDVMLQEASAYVDAESLANEEMMTQVMESDQNKRRMWTVLGVLALGYMFFGGRK